MKFILCLCLGLLAVLPVRGVDQSCGNSQCIEGALCGSNGTCTCDTSKGFAPGRTGDGYCSCDLSKTKEVRPGLCRKKVGQPCSDVSECIPTTGMVCQDVSGTKKCTCNTKDNFAAGSDGDTTCNCKANSYEVNGVCHKAVGQPCNDVSECIRTRGMVCQDVSGTKKCMCNTKDNFAAGSDGDTTCHCKANSYEVNGVCHKTVGQPCNDVSECIRTTGMVCQDVSGTKKCTCNTKDNFAAGSDGDTTCHCKANSYEVNGVCHKTVGQPCNDVSECIRTRGMVCQDVSGTKKCTCNTKDNFAAGSDGDTTCHCEANSREENGVCYKTVGQRCNDVSECIRTTGMVCQDVSGTKKCTCNTKDNFAAGNDGDATCHCETYSIEENGVCYKTVGQPCSDVSECIRTRGMVCQDVSGTKKCTCNTNDNFAAGWEGDTTCHCEANSREENGVCYKTVGQPCSDVSECIRTRGMVCQDVSGTKKCTCNTNDNFAAGRDGDTTCRCDATSREENGVCYKSVGQPCSDVSECIRTTGMVCQDVSGTKKCTCNTKDNFAAGWDGQTTCYCDANFHQENGVCYKTVGQPCNDVSECIRTRGMVCQDVSGTKKCTCNTKDNFGAGRDGDTTCHCETYSIEENGVCYKTVGQPCNDVSECIRTRGMVCQDVSGTKKCRCNTRDNFAAGWDGDATCHCDANSLEENGVCYKTVGQPCNDVSECIHTTGMVCQDVSGTKKCTCNTNDNFGAGRDGDTTCYCDANSLEENGVCYKTVGQPCNDVSECIHTTGMVCQDVSGTKKCTCNTNDNFGAGRDGDTTCYCDANSLEENGVCYKTVGQPCNDVSECIRTRGMVCQDVSGTKKCTCNTNDNFGAGRDGDTTCYCDANFYQENGVCYKTVGQPCNDVSECIRTRGMVCQDVSGTKKCTCNTNDNFGAGSDGDTTCYCDANSREENGVCYKTVGQPCNDVSECIRTRGIVCKDVSGTKKCTCNTNDNFGAGSDGDTTCRCDANSRKENGVCYKTVGQPCNAVSECIRTLGMVCQDVNGTKKCMCNTNDNFGAGSDGDTTCQCADSAVPRFINGKIYCGNMVGGTCDASINDLSCNSGSAGLFVSLTVLVTGMLMTSTPI